MELCHDHGNIYHQYTPVLLASIYHTWILWDWRPRDANLRHSRFGFMHADSISVCGRFCEKKHTKKQSNVVPSTEGVWKEGYHEMLRVYHHSSLLPSQVSILGDMQHFLTPIKNILCVASNDVLRPKRTSPPYLAAGSNTKTWVAGNHHARYTLVN